MQVPYRFMHHGILMLCFQAGPGMACPSTRPLAHLPHGIEPQGSTSKEGAPPPPSPFTELARAPWSRGHSPAASHCATQATWGSHTDRAGALLGPHPPPPRQGWTLSCALCWQTRQCAMTHAQHLPESQFCSLQKSKRARLSQLPLFNKLKVFYLFNLSYIPPSPGGSGRAAHREVLRGLWPRLGSGKRLFHRPFLPWDQPLRRRRCCCCFCCSSPHPSSTSCSPGLPPLSRDSQRVGKEGKKGHGGKGPGAGGGGAAHHRQRPKQRP